ncbi:transposase [Staphylococcus epidermidis]|uniref:transposase n=1 Tax=Staphylococcus epidermidis TaxID=1282 RepID=UPI001886B11F|nr:transposase [Staphylococcus epidermidis]
MSHKKFKPVVETLRKCTDLIINTLTSTNLNNGLIKDLNNKIKLIKKHVSDGYKNCNHLRSRIILCSKFYAHKPKKRSSNVSLLNLFS